MKSNDKDKGMEQLFTYNNQRRQQQSRGGRRRGRAQGAARAPRAGRRGWRRRPGRVRGRRVQGACRRPGRANRRRMQAAVPDARGQGAPPPSPAHAGRAPRARLRPKYVRGQGAPPRVGDAGGWVGDGGELRVSLLHPYEANG